MEQKIIDIYYRNWMKRIFDKAFKRANEYLQDNTSSSEKTNNIPPKEFTVCLFKDGDNFLVIADPNKRDFAYKVKHSDGDIDNLTCQQFHQCIYERLLKGSPLFNKHKSKIANTNISLF